MRCALRLSLAQVPRGCSWRERLDRYYAEEALRARGVGELSGRFAGSPRQDQRLAGVLPR